MHSFIILELPSDASDVSWSPVPQWHSGGRGSIASYVGRAGPRCSPGFT